MLNSLSKLFRNIVNSTVNLDTVEHHDDYGNMQMSADRKFIPFL